MAHPDIEPTPGVRFSTQQGVGQGTTIRRRRNPRKEVNDVSISQADGIALGVDGNYHPIETTPQGDLKVRVRDVTALLEEMIDLQKRMIFAMTEDGWDLDYEDLMDEKLPDC